MDSGNARRRQSITARYKQAVREAATIKFFIFVYFCLFLFFFSYCLLSTICGEIKMYIICPRPCKLTLKSCVQVTCNVRYLYANFSLPRPLCSRLRPDVRDRQTSDRQTSDAHHRLMFPTLGAGA